MELFQFNMALGASLYNFGKENMPYKPYDIFIDMQTEYFLQSLTWNTELKEFSGIDTLILRCRNNKRLLYTILRRCNNNFSLRRIAQSIRRCYPNNIKRFDIINISLHRKQNRLYLTYNLVS